MRNLIVHEFLNAPSLLLYVRSRCTNNLSTDRAGTRKKFLVGLRLKLGDCFCNKGMGYATSTTEWFLALLILNAQEI